MDEYYKNSHMFPQNERFAGNSFLRAENCDSIKLYQFLVRNASS